MNKQTKPVKRIQNYQDLLEEKERLQFLLTLQKEDLARNIDSIKEEFAPARSVLSAASKLLTREGNNGLLNAGSNALIDLVVKKLILSKAGWITRLVIPFVIKNYSSHFISENKNAFFNKIFSWMGKKNANGKKVHSD